jgi:hypothetical protein
LANQLLTIATAYRATEFYALEKKKREVKVLMPRFYFFFAGAFFTSFLAGFFAIKTTSGFNVCQQFVYIIC